MYVKRNYGFWMTFNWSKMPFVYGAIYAAILTAISLYTPFSISLPWQPISIIGIAVAFYLGFKNNSSYDRTWEARKIWGNIVNTSRTFATGVTTFITGMDTAQRQSVEKELIYRHVAWLIALVHQLRLAREWEHDSSTFKRLFIPTICEQYFEQLDKELAPYIAESEIAHIKSKANMATQLLAKQTERLRQLHLAGHLSDYRWMHLHKLIGGLYDGQGASERIKNFPFPRQYASTALWITMVFSILIPFGLLDIFEGHHPDAVWLAVPFSGLINWVFFLMEKIGDYSENPFEGTYNDVPISSIARAIEIDLRQMINDTDIPSPVKPENGFLM